MTSSLAAQLQRITATSTNTLNTQKLKQIHSASLLFPASHAATQDLETIYSIATEGFGELCQLDDRFIAYERGLFSESSKGVDRFLLPRDEVDGLDRSIEGFLQLVSGKLLLRPALKATEWLVRRFRYQFCPLSFRHQYINITTGFKSKTPPQYYCASSLITPTQLSSRPSSGSSHKSSFPMNSYFSPPTPSLQRLSRAMSSPTPSPIAVTSSPFYPNTSPPSCAPAVTTTPSYLFTQLLLPSPFHSCAMLHGRREDLQRKTYYIGP